MTVVARVQPAPAPRGRARLLVDAAAGHGYVGLCAAALLGWRRVRAIERDDRRLRQVEAAAAKLEVPVELELRPGTLGADAALVPAGADLVVALHACGAATDGVLAAAVTAGARFILCAPCCYGAAIPGWDEAIAKGQELGLPRDAAVRGRFAAAIVDGARLLRLRAAGYDAQLISFTAPTVTPHHLLFVARRGGRIT